MLSYPPSLTAMPSSSRRIRNLQRGLTLVEIMISLGVLAVTSVGGVSAFLLLNRYAANNRNLAAARELCQERIEQAMAMTYVPVSSTPSVPGQSVNGSTGVSWKILGNANQDPNPNYDVNGLLTSTTPVTTSNEPVNIYLKQETGTTVVAGTRTTTIALPTGLQDIVQPSKGQLKMVQFTVSVSYNFRGQNYTYTMYTMRGAD